MLTTEDAIHKEHISSCGVVRSMVPLSMCQLLVVCSCISSKLMERVEIRPIPMNAEKFAKSKLVG